MTEKDPFDVGSILRKVRDELENLGVSVDIGGDSASVCCEAGDARIRFVCVAPGLKQSVEEMGKATRDQVVMVRVDAETLTALDDWVETDAVKSRSEAAALFIREGLKVREEELGRLRDALRDVEEARERLRKQARDVFGQDG